jgi:hypothetical protein
VDNLTDPGARSTTAAIVYTYMGDEERCRAVSEEAREIYEPQVLEQPEDARLRILLAVTYFGLGRRDESLEQVQLAVELSQADPWRPGLQRQCRMSLAHVLTWCGELDAAFDIIETMLEDPSYGFTVPLLQINPIWTPLRGHPRFAELVEKYGPGSEEPPDDR